MDQEKRYIQFAYRDQERQLAPPMADPASYLCHSTHKIHDPNKAHCSALKVTVHYPLQHAVVCVISNVLPCIL